MMKSNRDWRSPPLRANRGLPVDNPIRKVADEQTSWLGCYGD